MKKNISLLLYFTTHLIYSQYSFSDIKKENLKGNIKTLHESYFEVDNIYDEILDEDGYPDMKIVGFKKGKPKGTDEYIGFKNFYNNNGFIIDQYRYYRNGELSGKIHYVRNENNQKIEFIDYNYVNGKFGEMKKHYSNSYIYSKNKLTEKSTNINTGKLYSTSIYNYNDGGKMIGFFTEYFNNGHKIKQEYIYDAENYLIQIITYNNGKRNNGPTFINDAKGNVIETNTYKTVGNSIKKVRLIHKYTYDHNDNWIEKITYRNENPEIITIREIEYY